MKVKSLSCARLLATPWTAAYQAPLSVGFPGKSTGVGCHCLLQMSKGKGWQWEDQSKKSNTSFWLHLHGLVILRQKEIILI